MTTAIAVLLEVLGSRGGRVAAAPDAPTRLPRKKTFRRPRDAATVLPEWD
ncbi:hypothetical protein [Streptomyces zagrosensis]|uniref:Uncharacterized protein n=1 Tax=Streptomyces zagrosensis TaxID=1042984 RepID=A0A7W9Q9A9_9ACTN|nr:hypothetical protein [Streptomyces zagrosensis]MBB5936011.1 hypothetical protein [Streptomyces zagrosensis]